MKKYLFTLFLVLILALSACGNSQDANDAAKDEKTKENIEEVNEDVESEIDKEFEKGLYNK